MATVQRYVNTASSGGDGTTNNTSGGTAAYASLSSWEANSGGSATDDYIVDCCGTAADATAVTVDFAVAFTTGSVTIRGNASDPAGKYNGTATISTSHYRLSSVAATCLVLTENNTTVDGIQAEAQGGAFRAAIHFASIAGNCTIRNNRVRASGACDSGIGTGGTATGSNGTWLIENNLVVGFTLVGIETKYDNFRTPTVTVRQNTVYGDGSSIGIQAIDGVSGAASFTIKGNAIGNTGASNALSVTLVGGSATYDDNATEDAQGTTGEIAIGTLANAWTSPGTTQAADFTVKDASSSLYSAVNPTLVTLDITGFTRDGTNHDVGCFEFQAPPPAAPVLSLPTVTSITTTTATPRVTVTF